MPSKNPRQLKYRRDGKTVTGTIKSIHGMRYMVDFKGEVEEVYERDLITPLTDAQYWGIVKEQQQEQRKQSKLTTTEDENT